MYMCGQCFFPLHATFSAGKSLTGSSKNGCSLSLVELSSQRVRKSAASVPALFCGGVSCCLQWCVWFWCLQLKDSQEPERPSGEVVR